jgi:dihydrofolate reductase
MTDIIIIAAVAQNGVIGKNNSIPWSISEDFKRFKNLTLGFPCIMGINTYLSLPDSNRPLPNRQNIVLTLENNYTLPGTVTVFNDFNESISHIRSKNPEKAFIIGGATIYRLGLDIADYMELTRIHEEFEGDAFFEYDDTKWEVISTSTHEAIDRISKLPIVFSYETLRRIK